MLITQYFFIGDMDILTNCAWTTYLQELLKPHSVPLMFLTYAKKSKGETFFPTFYDAKKVRISQEKHLFPCFPLIF